MNNNKFDIGEMTAGEISYKYYLLSIRDNKRYRFYIYAISRLKLIPRHKWRVK